MQEQAGVRIFQFNLWQEGTVVAGGFDKIIDIILASQADIVALSEVRNYGGEDLHTRLMTGLRAAGHPFFGQYVGGGAGLISRWPIKKAHLIADFTQSDSGSISAYHLTLDRGISLVVCSAHLDYKNYAVYLPRGYDGNSFKPLDDTGIGKPQPVTDIEQLHAMDKASKRGMALKAFLRFVSGLKDDIPVVIAGDLNECSHLDWTPATKDLYSHNGVVIEWRNSMMLNRAGFKDSWRELYPNPVTHPGATWPSEAWMKGSTSWAPKADERDRIDFIYYKGKCLQARQAWLVGSPYYYIFDRLVRPATQCRFMLSQMPWPSDHKGLICDFFINSEKC